MNKDRHFYIIIGLLIVIVALLVFVLREARKPVTSLIDQAVNNIRSCNEKVEEWRQKHPAGTTVDDSARNELSGILDNCISLVGESK
ncbi:MAG: hypothetical protein L6Q29_02050 [Candidatus Pacebacteria bacterium]|nr:hypothetical protein [Candidatus Paceibacterota bacterium]NUQ56967.1 hypothetical protein [Candidatus Paceibacter sp.]